jgi:predicted nucleotidyltransferase
VIKKRLSLRRNEEVAIRRLKVALSGKFNLIDFRIFGSKARGDHTAESDIDVMIEIDESNPYIESQIDDIIFKINLENDTLISATFFSKKELEEGPMSESPIYKVIQKEGIPI